MQSVLLGGTITRTSELAMVGSLAFLRALALRWQVAMLTGMNY
jgi:hypothetical protein